MITVILSIILLVVWVLGGVFVSVLTGWEWQKTLDLLKLIFWPITIFICRA